MNTLEGRTVVVIGGSSGIGLATAKAAIDEGASAVVTGRSPERLQEALASLGPGASGRALDSNDEAGTRAFFESLARVDHLFVSAGTVGGSGLQVGNDVLRPQMDTRFWGSIYAARHAVPRMPADGSITFCSGVASKRPRKGAMIGSSSCAAVEALARSLAVELAPIRANVVIPGMIDTPLLGRALGPDRDAALAQMSKRVPAGRVGRAEEIAHAVLFLMQNGYVTGTTLTVDGGFLLV